MLQERILMRQQPIWRGTTLKKPEKCIRIYVVDALNQYPERGRPGRIFGTRELVISGYPFIVPYRVRRNEVQILRVFHTSRQLPEDC